MSLGDLLHASAVRHGARPAITEVAAGRTLDYAELAARADTAAAALRSAGVAAPHRIALLGTSSLAYVAVAFGILAAGGCLVPIAANVRDAERDEIFRTIDVNGVVAVPDDGGDWSFAWLDRARRPPEGFAALDPAFVRFSSGTTADAKGVVLSHAATLARIAAADAVLRLAPHDRILWTLPLAYHFAVTIPSYVRAGAHVLLAPESTPATMAAALAAHEATVLYASPVLLARLAALAAPPRLPALRLALSTAAPLAPDVARRFDAAYRVPLGQAYGIIEAGLACINTRQGADRDLPAASVGRPVPGYEVATFADDEVGVRGPGLFDAYYAPWRPRAEVLRDGWFMTGDVGTVDAAAALTLRGRRKSTIVVAGLKLFPEEVEAVLAAHPTVAESRVVARPHRALGELPHAEIVLRPGTRFDRDALARHCAARLSPWKMPVTYTVVAAIPKTPGGKILRRPEG
ncbi:MAG: AMP-binding protein [Deltaproteobacteria bacterium]|nr:AMP-binding protein [Deltaproteobacteria bacterium]